MQLEFFIPLVLFLNILRLWGRRKVHSPPTPFPMHYNFFFNLLLPSQIFLPPSLPCLPTQSTLSGNQSLSSRPSEDTAQGASPTQTWLYSWFLLSSALFLVLFLSVGCG